MAEISLAGRNLLVLGKTSYIGNYIAASAERAGATVVAVSSQECNLLDGPQCERFFQGLPQKPYSVVFASVINKTVENSFESFQRNIELAHNFARAQAHALIDNVIYLSSVDVYGRAPALPITEASPILPDTWYGLAKYNCECVLSSLEELRCPVSVLRIPGVYGPSANDRSIIGWLVRSLHESGTVSIQGSGKILRDYVFLNDVFSVICRLLTEKACGAMNLVSGRSHSIVEIIDSIGELLGKKTQVRHEPADSTREFDLVYDNKRIRSFMPDFEFTALPEGLRSYVKTL